MTLRNEDFIPPLGLPLHNPDSMRTSQSFIYRKKHFRRMNSVIKRVFHCNQLTLIKDWTIQVSFSSYFSSIMKTISIQLLEIKSVRILPVDFCMSGKYGHSVFTLIFSSYWYEMFDCFRKNIYFRSNKAMGMQVEDQ